MALYNGWKNRETWNVSLWIRNDERFQSIAETCEDYPDFLGAIREAFEGEIGGLAYETPDEVAWNDSSLDREALNRVIREAGGRE